MKILIIVLLTCFSINTYAIDCSKEKPYKNIFDDDYVEGDEMSDNYSVCFSYAVNCDKLNKREKCALLKSFSAHVNNILAFQKNIINLPKVFSVSVSDYYSNLNPAKLACSAIYQISGDASKCLQMRELEDKYTAVIGGF